MTEAIDYLYRVLPRRSRVFLCFFKIFSQTFLLPDSSPTRDFLLNSLSCNVMTTSLISIHTPQPLHHSNFQIPSFLFNLVFIISLDRLFLDLCLKPIVSRFTKISSTGHSHSTHFQTIIAKIQNPPACFSKRFLQVPLRLTPIVSCIKSGTHEARQSLSPEDPCCHSSHRSVGHGPVEPSP